MKRWIPITIFALMLGGILLWQAQPPQLAQVPQGGEPFHCVQAVSTATALTQFTGQCGAIEADRSFYISSVYFSANSAGIAADSFPTLKYGLTTGTVTVFWGAFTPAAVQSSAWETIIPPAKIPPGNNLYWIETTAGSKFIVLDGFKGPQ